MKFEKGQKLYRFRFDSDTFDEVLEEVEVVRSGTRWIYLKEGKFEAYPDHLGTYLFLSKKEAQAYKARSAKATEIYNGLQAVDRVNHDDLIDRLSLHEMKVVLIRMRGLFKKLLPLGYDVGDQVKMTQTCRRLTRQWAYMSNLGEVKKGTRLTVVEIAAYRSLGTLVKVRNAAGEVFYVISHSLEKVK